MKSLRQRATTPSVNAVFLSSSIEWSLGIAERGFHSVKNRALEGLYSTCTWGKEKDCMSFHLPPYMFLILVFSFLSLRETPRASMSLREPPRASMSLREPPWASMSLDEPQWASVSLREPPWASKNLYQSQSWQKTKSFTILKSHKYRTIFRKLKDPFSLNAVWKCALKQFHYRT